MDRRAKIIEIMELFLVNEERSKDKAAPFKVRAYKNAIQAVIDYNKPIVSEADVDALQGIGKKIRDKMYEIVETGDLEEAKELKSFEMVRKELLDIYGVGPAKADDLIDNYGVRSIQDLIALVYNDRSILTAAQTLGLIYYDDLKQRIPREEIQEYERILRTAFRADLSTPAKLRADSTSRGFDITIVGSYRRGLPTSGDIDVLVSWSNGMSDKEARTRFSEIIDTLIENEFMVGVLAKGKTKLLSIVKAQKGPGTDSNNSNSNYIARRMDILLTAPEEIACALLYFTGSKEFNVSFRNYALFKGYTLNEYRLKKIKESLPIPEVPEFHTEKDVFDFLGIKYQSPEERVGPIEVY
jgi:DNA polymerase/3'-5' exonuclease PolX